MLEVLLDSLEAAKSGVQPYPFLYRTLSGAGVQYEVGGGGIAHRDQYLKVMGELGLPSRTAIRLPDGGWATIEDLIRNSLLTFEANQELEFTAVAYSRWLPPTHTWRDRYGLRHDFDELANLLLAKGPGDGACHGTHSLYALINLIRINEQTPIIEQTTLDRITMRVRHCAEMLVRNQAGNGAWYGQWHASDQPLIGEPEAYQAIWMTGHHLEWIALAPEAVRPARESIERAARALATLVPQHSVTTVSNNYPEFSHAARSLTLLARVDPAYLLLEGAVAAARSESQ